MCLLGFLKFHLLNWPAIINFNMPDIWQTNSENFQLEKIQNVRLSAIINFNMPDI